MTITFTCYGRQTSALTSKATARVGYIKSGNDSNGSYSWQKTYTKEVGKGFKCSGCRKLISLDGMPEKILSGTFSAKACGKELTKIDVIKRLKSDSGLINMNLNLRPANECKFDAVSLGEFMLRLDPGEGRIRTARQFRAGEGGGE